MQFILYQYIYKKDTCEVTLGCPEGCKACSGAENCYNGYMETNCKVMEKY